MPGVCVVPARRTVARLHSAVFPLLVAAALVACGDTSGDGAGVPAAVVRDSAGITIVENPPEAQRTRVLHEVDTGTVVVARGADGEVLEFEAISAVIGQADGSFIAVDRAAPYLRAFGSNGMARWSAVGEGNGPGELPEVSTVGRIRGDSLVVNEAFGTRGLLLAPNGTVVGDLPRRVARDSAGVERPMQVWAALGDGAGVGFVQRMRREYFEGVGPVTMEMPVVLTSRDGATTTPLGDHPYARSGRGDDYLTIAHMPFFALGASDSRLVLGWPQTSELRIYDAAGSLTRVVRTPGERRATTAEEADRGRDALLSRSRRNARRSAIASGSSLRIRCRTTCESLLAQTAGSGANGSRSRLRTG